MRLKSFHGANLTEVMREVRTALGDNAIIVATRDDEGGGVRVTAAIEDTGTAPSKTAATAPPVEGSEAVEIVAEALTRHQVASHIAERLLATATQFANDDPVLALGAALDAHFEFKPIVEDKPDKPLILIGPPGAGKTLCIAKFTAKATLGKRPVTVFSTDFERAGGTEQLAAFTRLLKLNLVEVEDAAALVDAIAMQKGAYVFVDTAGCNPYSERERLHTRKLVEAVGGEAALVLPAGLDANEAADMAQQFRTLGAVRLILTRLEMTRRLGSVLRIAFDARMPLANFSASSNVTEAPQPFNPVVLARFLLRAQDSGYRIQEEKEQKQAKAAP